MALLQISEPDQMSGSRPKKLAVGIDLGTTNSLIATVKDGHTNALTDSKEQVLLPSVVRYLQDSVQVGVEALAQAKQDPLNTISSAKRLIGRGAADMSELERLGYRLENQGGMVCLQTCQGVKNPVEVSAEILKALAARAKDHFDEPITGAVITVPAYFDETQRQATKQAAKLAGLPLLRLLSEPTAAAIAYGLDRAQEGVVAIYDLGGGTFDISLLELKKGVFQVLATGGDSSLGGDDFDQAIANWILAQKQTEAKDLTSEDIRKLLLLSRQIKEKLSQTEQVSIEYGGWQGVLSQQQFAQLISPLLQKTLEICQQTLADASLQAQQVDHVVLVGGSTRVPAVPLQVKSCFLTEPLTDLDPDQVVALGAAIQADNLAGNGAFGDMLLLDVIPLSLGLETMGGLMEKVIPRNSPIPITKAQEFTTYADGQTGMVIQVLQGERELVKDNRSLAKFELKGIPPMAAGAAKVQVLFQVDADGILSVSAEEKSTQTSAQIQVKPSYGLSDEQIVAMLQSSYTHAKEDIKARMLSEKRIEGQRVVEGLRSALLADGKQLLSIQQYQALVEQMKKLEEILKQEEVSVLEKGIEDLTKACDSFAQSRMDYSIQMALGGQSIDKLES